MKKSFVVCESGFMLNQDFGVKVFVEKTHREEFPSKLRVMPKPKASAENLSTKFHESCYYWWAKKNQA
jgi:hypothetical protein